MDFANKTVIVTGAGSGIGRALFLGFAADGANVVGFGRNETTLARTCELTPSTNTSIVVGDVTSEDDVDRLFGAAVDRYGQVDVLINNAAVYPKKEFLVQTHSEWKEVIDINVVGVALCCRRALHEMLSAGFGRIVNLGSFAWRSPRPDSSAYAVSKSALSTLTRALAAGIDRDRDILINELVPGPVKTSMSSRGKEPEEVYQHVKYVAGLPTGGPTGRTFARSRLHTQEHGTKARVKRLLWKVSGGAIGSRSGDSEWPQY